MRLYSGCSIYIRSLFIRLFNLFQLFAAWRAFDNLFAIQSKRVAIAEAFLNAHFGAIASHSTKRISVSILADSWRMFSTIAFSIFLNLSSVKRHINLNPYFIRLGFRSGFSGSSNRAKSHYKYKHFYLNIYYSMHLFSIT